MELRTLWGPGVVCPRSHLGRCPTAHCEFLEHNNTVMSTIVISGYVERRALELPKIIMPTSRVLSPLMICVDEMD